VEQVECLLIKYHPGKADGAALIKLACHQLFNSHVQQLMPPKKSGALVHEGSLTIAGMTISGMKERFAAYTVSSRLSRTSSCETNGSGEQRRFLRDLLHFQPTHSRKTASLAKMLATVAGDAFMDDLHTTARSASTEAIMILRSLLSRSSIIEIIKSVPVLGPRKAKKIKEAGEADSEPNSEDDELLIALSEAYNSLGDAHKVNSQWDMAERAYESGVRVLRVLSERRPREFLKPLCLQLGALAMTQLGMNKFAESAVSRHESITIRRDTCVASIRAHGRELTNRALGPTLPPGITVRNYTEQCIEFCKSLYREARGIHIVDQECIRIRRMLHQDNDPLHREHLARTLLAHARSLRHMFLKQASHMNSTSQPASQYHTVMEVEEPLLELEDLVRALNQQGWNLGSLGCYGEAADAFSESVTISRVLQSHDSSSVGAQNLPYCLCALGDCLYSSGRPQEAVSAIGEAVGLAREWHSGTAFLANLLASYSRALRTAGRVDVAVSIGTESSKLWEEVFQNDPVAIYGTKIAFSNFALANALVRRDVGHLV
jgi:tetratricopeptide (TPR) repeat protein